MALLLQEDVLRVKQAFQAAATILADLEGAGAITLRENPDDIEAASTALEIDRELRLQSEIAAMLVNCSIRERV